VVQLLSGQTRMSPPGVPPARDPAAVPARRFQRMGSPQVPASAPGAQWF